MITTDPTIAFAVKGIWLGLMVMVLCVAAFMVKTVWGLFFDKDEDY